MAEKEKESLEIVTEIGTFGSLNIEDPTTKKIVAEEKSKAEDEELVMDLNDLAKIILKQ
jgi:hypothetical protein